MLEKPTIPDDRIIACVKDAYAIAVAQITFLPLGVDVNAAVYRVVAEDGTAYFLKLRRGAFYEISVTLPKFLHEQGIAQIIPPLVTRSGRLWADMGEFRLILYPFVDGQNGYEVRLTDQHWIEFGAALRRIHMVVLPSTLRAAIPQETYSAQWREVVRTLLARVATETWQEPVAAKTAAYLNAKRTEILDLIQRTERLAQRLQAEPLPMVVCHADIHAGNVLIDTQGKLHIVDWDAPILAPKERDLMFSGGGQFGSDRTPPQENALFYQGYGETEIDQHALAYYRYERIIDDIAAFGEQLLLTDEGGEDREQAFLYLTYNFSPDGMIAVAVKADKTR